MTMWHTNLITPVQRMEYNDKQFLRTPDQLLGTGTGFWGPPASAIKSALPEDYGKIKLVELGISAPDAHGYARPNTIWVVGPASTTPDAGIWVLNVSDNYAKEQAERYGQKLMAGWYMKIGPVPFAETLWTSELKRQSAEDNWALYNKVVGRSIAEISAENEERRKKAAADVEDARQKKEIADQEQLAKDIKAGKVPASTTTGGTTGTPIPGSWMVADTTYELVALQGGAPIPLDVAERAPKTYQWKLTDDPNAGFRLAGRPGAGPYVSGGASPASFGLPAYVVGRASTGQAGVIKASALTALFGPDWAKP